MSATARSARASAPSSTRPAPRPAPRKRAELREVPAPAPAVAGNLVFALVVTGVLVLGAMLLLVLNTALAQGAFEMSELTKTKRDLAVREQTLLQQVARAEAPESLQARAEKLGMVPVAAPVFLRLADGKVLGVPRAAKAAPVASIPRTGGTTTATSTKASDAAKAATARTEAAARAKASDAAAPDPAPQSDAAVSDAAAPVTTSGNGARR
jgi:hypothetical protein